MKKIVKNRFLDALFKLMILSSIIHIMVIIVYSVLNLSVTKLNFFDILNLELLYPPLNNYSLVPLVATLIMVELFVLFLLNADKE